MRLIAGWMLLSTYCLSASFAQTFTSTASMNEARAFHTATLLNDGTVLVTGGLSNTAEIYNPETRTWRYTAHPMTAQRGAHSAVKLNNGKVLLTGGQLLLTGTEMVSAELYDPMTETFVAVARPTAPHSSQPGLLLNDGRVIVVAGSLPYCGTTAQVSEIYDPVSDTWTQLAPFPVGPDARAVALADGSILAFGGGSCPPYPNVVRYDPASNVVTPMTSMLTPRLEPTATVLTNGRILLTAGSDPSFVTNTTELYDPQVLPSGQSLFGNPLTDARRQHTATLLPNGDVVVAGGYQSGNGYGYVRTLASAELFNHDTLIWSSAGSMSAARVGHTATLLPSGSVLIIGGLSDNSYSTMLNTAELWTASVQTGTITVTSNLATASFTISNVLGSPTYNGSGRSFTQANVPAGTYRVHYNDVAKYVTPQDQSFSLAPGQAVILPEADYSPITLSVCTTSAGCAQPPTLFFSYDQGSASGNAAQQISITSNASPLSFSAAVSTNPADGNWLSVSAFGGTTPATLNVSTASNLKAGVYAGYVSVTSEIAQNSPIVISVLLTVTKGDPNKPKPTVLIVPGIFGTKLANDQYVVWLSNHVLNDTFFFPERRDLDQLKYTSSGNPSTPLSVVAIAPDGKNYGGLFNLFSKTGDSGYALDCNIALVTNPWGDVAGCQKNEYVYNNLYDRLRAAGYPVQTFAYDWRRDIAALGDELAARIQSLATAQPQGGTIAIVAHSMGGLVIAEALARHGKAINSALHSVTTLGTPFAGSVQAYSYLRGWDTILPKLLSNQDSKTLGENWTSAYDLLPQWPFVTLIKGAAPIPATFDGTYSPLLPALPRAQGTDSALMSAASVWHDLSALKKVKHSYAIVGSGHNTLYGVVEPKATPGCLIGLLGDGDGTVPIQSSTASTWVETTLYTTDIHVGLPSNNEVLVAVQSILDGTEPTNLSTTPQGVTNSTTSSCFDQ